MSYTALYRKFRPNRFEDVKGQNHIVTTLKNQIKADKMGHAYLFCGTRGTGKTSVAKIFAKAVNCEHPIDGSPCNECSICKAIQAGASMNVIEIDAASNNGVDNIREIRDEVQYSPTEGKYKVYIIDEVHMLSIGAFNALLKTLEEPPSYVIFILATTEAHKIPVTILSRCQRYDFKRLSLDIIALRLSELLEEEKIEAEEKAIRYIAKSADGAMRDALSLLDQCLAFYMDQKLTYENILEVLGAIDTEVFSGLLRKIIAQDTLGTIKQLEQIIMDGRDLNQFVIDFIWYMRNLLFLQSTEDIEDILDVSKEARKALQEEANMIEPEVLMRYIRVFSELSSQIKYASQKRVLIEIALIKLTKPAMESNYDSILNRLSLIEKQLEQGIIVSKPEKISQPSNAVQTQPLPTTPKEAQDIIEVKGDIIRKLDHPLKNYIRSCRFQEAGENRFILVTKDEIAYGMINTPEKKEELERVIFECMQKEITIDIKLENEIEHNVDAFLNAQKNIHMEIEEE